MAHTQKPDFVFRRNGRVHLNWQGRQFSRLLAAEVCVSPVVMLDTPCSEGVLEYWLPTPFDSFPFTSPPVRHRVSSGFRRTIRKTLITQFTASVPYHNKILHHHYGTIRSIDLRCSKCCCWRLEPLMSLLLLRNYRGGGGGGWRWKGRHSKSVLQKTTPLIGLKPLKVHQTTPTCITARWVDTSEEVVWITLSLYLS